MNPAPSDQKLGKTLLRYAREDEWDECLEILNQHSTVCINKCTKDGDYLVHLAAYAACEADEDEDDDDTTASNQDIALQCLSIVLERDAFAHQQVARDGGTALHAALASASSCLRFDSHEDDALIESVPSQDDSRWKHTETARKAIQLLLRAGSNPNVCLLNTEGIGETNGEDDEEVDLSYARDAVVEEWTPLVMCIVWMGLMSRAAPSASLDRPYVDVGANIAMSILLDVIEAGADASLSVGSAKWKPIDYAVSLTYQLSLVKVKISQPHLRKYQSCDDLTAWEAMRKILTLRGSPDISVSQSVFIAALLDDETAMRNVTVIHECSEKTSALFDEQIHNIVPLPQMIWGEAKPSDILSVAASFLSSRVSNIMLKMISGNRGESTTIKAVQSIFSNPLFVASRPKHPGQIRQRMKTICEDTINILSEEDTKEKILDKLLFISCVSGWGWPDALPILLELGADASGRRLRDCVDGNFTPLHLISGRTSRGNAAAQMAKVLVANGASVYSRNTDNLTPLEVAIRYKNRSMVDYLWMCERDDSTENQILSINQLWSLGEIAVENANMVMLEVVICQICDVPDQLSPERLGALLLLTVNPRSAMGMCKVKEDVERLKNAVKLLSKAIAKSCSPAFIQKDEVTGYTVFHHILRDRHQGSYVREALGRPLCELAREISNPHFDASSILNLPCAKKFGGYTSLHLACAVNCEASISLLIEFGADPNILDSEGCSPAARLRRKVNLPDSIIDKLGCKNKKEDDVWSDIESDSDSGE